MIQFRNFRRLIVHVSRLTCGILPALAVLTLSGCKTLGTSDQSVAGPDQVALLLPARIRMVEGFSGFRDEGGDPNPEQVELVLQPLNRFDEPTRMVGALRIELYEFLPASGENRGPRLYQWDVPLRTEADQKKYWDSATRMYNLALVLGGAPVTAGRKYTVEVTYLAPFGERMSEVHTLEVVRRNPQLG